MKKIVCPLVLSLIGCLSISTSSAWAASRPGALAVTLGGGYVYLDSKREMDNRSFGMLEVGYDFTEHWGIEGFLAGFQTHFKDDVNADVNSDADTHVNGTVFDFDAVYHFSSLGIVEPYILAGVGLTGLSPNGFDSTNIGNINGAVGANVFVTKSIALRLEARDNYTLVGGKNDVYLNGGVSVLFDFC